MQTSGFGRTGNGQSRKFFDKWIRSVTAGNVRSGGRTTAKVAWSRMARSPCCPPYPPRWGLSTRQSAILPWAVAASFRKHMIIVAGGFVLCTVAERSSLTFALSGIFHCTCCAV